MTVKLRSGAHPPHQESRTVGRHAAVLCGSFLKWDPSPERPQQDFQLILRDAEATSDDVSTCCSGYSGDVVAWEPVGEHQGSPGLHARPCPMLRTYQLCVLELVAAKAPPPWMTYCLPRVHSQPVLQCRQSLVRLAFVYDPRSV